MTTFDSPSKHVLMHTRFIGSKQWINFLFLDGHCEGREVTSISETLKKNSWIMLEPKAGKDAKEIENVLITN